MGAGGRSARDAWRTPQPALCERGPVRLRILEGAETRGEIGAVFERLEVRFGIRVVVGHMGARVGLGHAQVGHEERHGFRGHRGTVIGVQGELARANALALAGRRDEPALPSSAL